MSFEMAAWAGWKTERVRELRQLRSLRPTTCCVPGCTSDLGFGRSRYCDEHGALTPWQRAKLRGATEAVVEHTRRWRRKNPERAREQNRRAQRRLRARRGVVRVCAHPCCMRRKRPVQGARLCEVCAVLPREVRVQMARRGRGIARAA